jgi:hypothetical protein
MPSTAIASFGYDEHRHELHVTFTTGRRYSYFNVPRAAYTGFVRAASKGVYFNRHIRDRYPYREHVRVA